MVEYGDLPYRWDKKYQETIKSEWSGRKHLLIGNGITRLYVFQGTRATPVNEIKH